MQFSTQIAMPLSDINFCAAVLADGKAAHWCYDAKAKGSVVSTDAKECGIGKNSRPSTW